MHPRVEKCLDILATVGLTASVAVAAVLFADLFKPFPGTIGTHPNNLQSLVQAAAFLGLLCAPTILSAISWPVYLRQKHIGRKVFGWCPFAVLISVLWSFVVFVALTGL